MATVAPRTLAAPPSNAEAGDRLFRGCLMGSAVAGVLFLVGVMLAPVRREVITDIGQLPQRFARLIIEPAKPLPKPALPPGDVVRPGDAAAPGPIAGAGDAVEPKPEPAGGGSPGSSTDPGPGGGDPSRAPGPGPTSGAAGRARAQAATQQLATSTAALTRSLGGLSASLGATGVVTNNGRPGRARAIRGGRSVGEMASSGADLSGSGGGDLGGSAVGGSWVSIGALSGSGSGGGSGGGSGFGSGGSGGGEGGGYGSGSGSGYGSGSGGGGGGHGSGPGVYRSNASLLAVIQRYQPGIQYCYSNQLKRDPALTGKLVVAITVAASGEVLDAAIVRNTVGAELASCALSQIREWRFGAIPDGVTTFQAPFVFTPPR